jgi:uncharacterized hydrophobic protein (TIGR00271 family)
MDNNLEEDPRTVVEETMEQSAPIVDNVTAKVETEAPRNESDSSEMVEEIMEQAAPVVDNVTAKRETEAPRNESDTVEELEPSNQVDLDSMKDAVFFLFPDKNRRLSRFFLLIGLSSVIATSGVAGDSVATVIGAMIVAPLMTPILGTMLSIVLGDGPNFVFSFFLVLSGAGMAVLIGFIYGLCLNEDTILAENNSQIAGRVKPKLTDLIGALATGAVGSIALVRKDIAPALPGVAIAISLVPPLCVAGLTLSTGDGLDAAGAMLLFATNFMSILIMGIVIMYFYKIHEMSSSATSYAGRIVGCMQLKISFVGLILLLGMVAVPLTLTSLLIREESKIEECLQERIDAWAEESGTAWEVDLVVATAGYREKVTAKVLITGEPPYPTDEDFVDAVVPCNVDEVILRFLPQRVIEL